MTVRLVLVLSMMVGFAASVWAEESSKCRSFDSDCKRKEKDAQIVEQEPPIRAGLSLLPEVEVERDDQSLCQNHSDPEKCKQARKEGRLVKKQPENRGAVGQSEETLFIDYERVCRESKNPKECLKKKKDYYYENTVSFSVSAFGDTDAEICAKASDPKKCVENRAKIRAKAIPVEGLRPPAATKVIRRTHKPTTSDAPVGKAAAEPSTRSTAGKAE